MSRKTLQRKQDFKQETFPDGSFTVISGYSDSSKVYRVQKLSYEAAKEGTENQTLLLDKNGNWRNFTMTSCNVLPRLKGSANRLEVWPIRIRQNFNLCGRTYGRCLGRGSPRRFGKF
jgi:hypothetical protein